MKIMMFKWAGNIVSLICVVIIIISIATMINFMKSPGNLPSVAGYTPMSVLSGSMRPLLEPGDMIVIRKVAPEKVKVGDVITYKAQDTLVTHRVVQILDNGQEQWFRTKGDANNVEDGKLISRNQLVGLLAFRIPCAGYIFAFIRSPIGIIILVILLTALLLSGEMKKLLSGPGKSKKESPNPEDNV